MKTTKDNVTVNQNSVARHDESLEDVVNKWMSRAAGFEDLALCAANWQKQRDSIIIKSLVEFIKGISAKEKHADEVIGMVDNPHTKALRAISREAKELLKQIENNKDC